MSVKDEVGIPSWESWPVSSRVTIERLEKHLTELLGAAQSVLEIDNRTARPCAACGKWLDHDPGCPIVKLRHVVAGAKQLQVVRADADPCRRALEILVKEVHMYLRHPMAHNELAFALEQARAVLTDTQP